MASSNPLNISISDVKIQKFNKTDQMSIMPQFVEISIFQSIFEPAISAEMLINDEIGLFFNYPFTGEELITITYDQINTGGSNLYNARTGSEIKFIIKGVRNVIVGDRARSMMYILDLVTPQYLQNTRKYVSHAYNDLVEDMAEKVYNEYIAEDTTKQFNLTKPFIKEESLKVRQMVVPNLRPFQALSWLAKHAVAKEYEKHFMYLFFEDRDNYNFITIQKIIEDALKIKSQLQQNKYRYISDAEIVKKAPTGSSSDELRLITNIVNNKRFSSIEKIAGGYYQNELFEINMLQKGYKSEPSELSGTLDNTVPTLGPYPLNTPDYIKYVKNEIQDTEYSNRIRYIVNNYPDNDGQGMSQPLYRRKFGLGTTYLFALNQMDFTITVPANMNLKAGQVIYCELPESHGFNTVSYDKYVSGLFIISEIKQVLAQGNMATTSIRIYKDGYTTGLYENSLYSSSSTQNGNRGNR